MRDFLICNISFEREKSSLLFGLINWPLISKLRMIPDPLIDCWEVSVAARCQWREGALQLRTLCALAPSSLQLQDQITAAL